MLPIIILIIVIIMVKRRRREKREAEEMRRRYDYNQDRWMEQHNRLNYLMDLCIMEHMNEYLKGD